MAEDNQKEAIKKAAKLIKEAECLLFTSGAGMSVDSGLPDFRGPEGFWRAYPPMAKLGLKFEEMSNPQWFSRDPTFAWGFWSHRINLYQKTIPHQGYQILKTIGESKKDNYFVFTSNVDGHFLKAGFPAEKIYECHGCVDYLQCTIPCCDKIWNTSEFSIPKIDENTFKAIEDLPKCNRCGELARPNVLMFGDMRYVYTRDQKQEGFFYSWRAQNNNKKLVIIGAGQYVPTIRRNGEIISRKTGGSLIRINRSKEDAKVPGDDDVAIVLGGLEALKEIQAALS
eukprot:TRINITY_DN6285_c0_g1_i4.p1 TRINITY_DN6285_c0_g1~~TRINITY_DN6285_c0_g1_i4.p1  ORF type:complete len:309 (-),score=64.45 TRINITY_DN6285_c0_g1_i4:129-977(-)